jgi:peptidyl-dipeptidase A
VRCGAVYTALVPSPSVLASDLTDRLAPLSAGSSLAWWNVNLDANPQTERRRVDAELALTDVLADRGLFERIQSARGNGADRLTRRQLDLFHDWFLPHQVPDTIRRRIVELEAAVSSSYARHRGLVGGEERDDNELKQILRTSDDVAERREAWEASKTIGAEVADQVRELARLRNEAARSLGFRDWFALAVTTMEMDEVRLFQTLDATDRVTRDPFARWKARLDERLVRRFGCSSVTALRPWHYDDPFFQEVPRSGAVDLDAAFAGKDVVALAASTFDRIGLETASILAASDLFPRAGKCQHAFCIDVDRSGDIRVLANVVHDRYWAETMLHELGHGVHSAGYERSLPWLLRDAHLTITEAVAILMGRLATEPEWLATGLDLEPEELGGPLRTLRAADLLVFTRWVLVLTNFERAFYRDPDTDADALWWELVHRFQLVAPPEGRHAPDWAAKIHVACAPVYYHTYLYGNLIASQLAAWLRREVGGLVGSESAGRLLVERVFRPGVSIRWDRLVQHATGEALSVEPYAAEIRAGIG